MTVIAWPKASGQVAGAQAVVIGPTNSFTHHDAEPATVRILVVDDNPLNLFAMKEMLGELGHEIVTVQSGREALRYLLEHAATLILMDVQMPDLDGYETVELIRSRERTRDVPIIFITGFGSDEQQVFRGYSAGAVDYVVKPVSPLILRSKVAAFIELYRKTEAIKRQAEIEKALLQENFRVRAEKLRADQALHRREEQYALIVNSQPVVLFTATPTAMGASLSFLSENIEAVTGFPAQRFLDDATFWRDRLHPDDRDRVLTELAGLRGHDAVDMEYRWRCADGSMKHFLGRVVRRVGDGGVELYGTSLDITERRRLEMELERAQRLEAIGRLTGGIAHDFNNMLSVVISSLDLLKAKVPGHPEAERFAGLALKGALRCADLTRHLLTFARRKPLASKLLDLGEFVSGMVDLLRHLLGDLFKITCTVEPGLRPILADPAQVEAALLNLVFNARDAMPEGGTLSVEISGMDFADKPPDGSRPGRHVAMRVTDTGHGMPPEVLARVFEPFFTTKGVGRGTGLGLSTTYGFIKQLGGHVAIESRVGAGTSVMLCFPTARETETEVAADDKPEAETSPHPRFKGTFLVVEDDDDLRDVAVATLNNVGIATYEARDAATALALIDQHPEIDVLFTDIRMPGMDGLELANRALARRSDLTVLYASGYGEPVPRPDFLPKPYRPQQLLAYFTRALATTG